LTRASKQNGATTVEDNVRVSETRDASVIMCAWKLDSILARELACVDCDKRCTAECVLDRVLFS
jgi:hypothetical protein